MRMKATLSGVKCLGMDFIYRSSMNAISPEFDLGSELANQNFFPSDFLPDHSVFSHESISGLVLQ